MATESIREVKHMWKAKITDKQTLDGRADITYDVYLDGALIAKNQVVNCQIIFVEDNLKNSLQDFKDQYDNSHGLQIGSEVTI